MKKSLNRILEEISVAKVTAEVNLDNVAAKFRPARAIAKNDAETQLKILREEYKSKLGPRVATIILSGIRADQAAFTTIAEAEGETLTIDAEAMYKKMAIDVEPTIGAQRQFGGTQLNHLVRSLEDVGRFAGAGFLPVPRLLDVEIARTPADTIALIKGLIRSQVGDSLNCRYIEACIVEDALACRYGEKIVPVVIAGASEEEASILKNGIFSGLGITFKVGATVDQKTVTQAFDALRERIKKQQ